MTLAPTYSTLHVVANRKINAIKGMEIAAFEAVENGAKISLYIVLYITPAAA